MTIERLDKENPNLEDIQFKLNELIDYINNENKSFINNIEPFEDEFTLTSEQMWELYEKSTIIKTPPLPTEPSEEEHIPKYGY
ncbi:MAG: hypothetical protein H8D97_00300 [Proteobacteria bacterium]|nr:hypothetical protein [Pseudomonadota bacterium]